MRLLPAIAALLPVAVLCAQEPPALRDHVERTSALAREHQYHASVAGTVLAADGKPVASAIALVCSHQPPFGSLPLARARTDERGRFHCPDVSGPGPALLWVVAPEHEAFRCRLDPIALVSGRHTELRPLRLPEGPATKAPPQTFRGRVLAKDGEPIVGGLLRLLPESGFDPSAYAITDANGAFAILVRTGTPREAQFDFEGTRVTILHDATAQTLVEGAHDRRIDLTGERTLQSNVFTSGTVPKNLGEGDEVEWQLDNWLPQRTGDRALDPVPSLRVSRKGHLPRFVDGEDTRPSFADDVACELQVVDTEGKPVRGAIVDFVDPTRGLRFQEPLLCTQRTDADGTVRLRAPESTENCVYVYADGFTPGRTTWSGTAARRLVLTRRSAKLRVSIDDDESTIHVRRAGTFDTEVVAYPMRGTLDLEVAPGAYEVSRYHDGKLVAAMAVSVAADARTDLALDADERPTVEIAVPEIAVADPTDPRHFAELEWHVHASRAAHGGIMLHGESSISGRPAIRTRALAAEAEAKGDGRFLLRLPTSGRYTLFARHGALEYVLLREVEVAFGQHHRIDVPPLDGALRAVTHTVPPGWDLALLSRNGIAGPRLWLEPDGDTAFGALVPPPEPKAFEVERLPRGTFTLHHHMYATASRDGDRSTWGGTPISIGETTFDAGTLDRGPDGELTVQVRRADGSAATGRLAIRDRMRESWEQALAGNTMRGAAYDPLPEPPSARLVDGTATLGRLRRGRVHFELRGDEGSTAFFARDVVPGTVLEVKLDALR